MKKLKRGIDDYIAWAKYYINTPHVTMAQVADKFGVSKKTVQNAMKKIQELGQNESEEMRSLSLAVEDKKNNSLVAGAKKGGRNGKPTTNGGSGGRHLTISIENLEKYADRIINGDISLRDLSRSTGIAKSTLHDNLTTRISDPEKIETLKTIFDSHKPENTPPSGKKRR